MNKSAGANDEPWFSMEEQQLFDQIKLEMGDNPTLVKCAEQFFRVKKCWNDYEECLKQNMTFERACHTLREIRDVSFGKRGGTKLSMEAHKLLWEIAGNSAPLPEVEAAEQIVAIYH